MNIVGIGLVVVAGFALGGCGIQRKPVNDAAVHISDTAAAGKAAQTKCATDKTNCDEVAKAFDLISADANGLKTLSAP